MFIDPKERVTVTDERGNTVWIKAKMDVATKHKVEDAVAAIGDDMGTEAVQIHIGSYNTALLIHNIVAWEGPDFMDEREKPVPCTPANIRRLDPDEPLVDMVLREINRRNARSQAPDPNSLTDDGSTSDTG